MSDLLQKAWDDGSCCGECPHYFEWQEHHPYGSTTAAETLAECRAPSAQECLWIKRRLCEQKE